MPKAQTDNLPVLLDQPDDIISLAKIIELRNKQLTYKEIGVILGCTKQNIHERLQPYIKSIDNLKAVKDNRADTLAVIGDTLLTSLTTDDIKKTSPYQKVGMFGILYDKERLERDKSTANVAYADLGVRLEGNEAQAAKLRAELGLDEPDSIIDAEVVDE